MPMSTKKRKGHVITFGLCGHGIEMNGCYLSGYEDPESFERRLAKGDYEEYDLEGALVIDKRVPLDRDPGLSVRMPMCDADLPVGEREPLPDRAKAGEMAPFMGGSFAALAALGANPSFEGLDFVAPDVYAALWKKQGARTGRLVTGKIVWDA